MYGPQPQKMENFSTVLKTYLFAMAISANSYSPAYAVEGKKKLLYLSVCFCLFFVSLFILFIFKLYRLSQRWISKRSLKFILNPCTCFCFKLLFFFYFSACVWQQHQPRIFSWSVVCQFQGWLVFLPKHHQPFYRSCWLRQRMRVRLFGNSFMFFI